MLMPVTTTPTELQRNYRNVVKKAKKAKDAIVVLSNNVPEAIYMDYDTYVEKFLKIKEINEAKTVGFTSANNELLSLAGSINNEEARKLISDIDEMFETVDEDEWK